MNSTLKRLSFAILFLSAHSVALFSQEARVFEKKVAFKTYPFSDPSPIPAFAYKPDIYPYFKYEGYSVEGKEQEWKLVTLENDYLSVTVMPEIGGRVWGAKEKSTGYDFIYENEVVKFRNIAMRGPWTSGGIEFNFGIIGHAPSTATPVDYVFFENPDGSVTCVVGALDLPSRTQWRVKINLPKDKAYFETEGIWYNPEPLRQPYYNWMTAAAHVGDDQEFFYPGHLAVQHSGSLMDWPIQEDRNVAMYKNNDFGSSKSHHMAGSFQNHFGGYFHGKGLGFGHFASYDDMPGKKLWLWALSRSGGIWEDLLTDDNGQYMEFQAGRMLNQFSPSRNTPTPLTKTGFTPYSLDKWTDYWFPVKGTGGISEVSTTGVFHVSRENDQVSIRFNPFQAVTGKIAFLINGVERESQSLNLKPMDLYAHKLNAPDKLEKLEIRLDGKQVYLWQAENHNRLSRPFDTNEGQRLSESEKLYYLARQDYNSRNYPSAKKLYEECLDKDPGHQRARIDYAELLFRYAQYDEALKNVNMALSTDFYDPQANFVAGSIYRGLNKPIDALEAYGWAARSMEFRSSAYTAMAEIHLSNGNLEQAKAYAQKALEFNVHQVVAYQVLAVAHRLDSNQEEASNLLDKLLDIDPLSHFARFEQYLLKKPGMNLGVFDSRITNEFPYQTYLELASIYLKYNQKNDAVTVLKSSPVHALVHLWLAYLDRENSTRHLKSFFEKPIDGVFPFRKETMVMLDWVKEKQSHWKTDYYRALNKMALGQTEAGRGLLAQLGQTPDEAVFYLNRASLLKGMANHDTKADLEKALQMDANQWRNHYLLGQYLETQEDYQRQSELLESAVKNFPGNYVLEMDLIKAWSNLGQYEQAMQGLGTVHVLPYEGAGEGRVIFENVYLNAALADLQSKKYNAARVKVTKSLEWPENLGVGKPFTTDETLQHYLLGVIAKASGRQKVYREQMDKLIVAYQGVENLRLRPQLALVIHAMESTGRQAEADALWKRVNESTNRNAAETIGQLTGRLSGDPSRKDREYTLVKKLLETEKGL